MFNLLLSTAFDFFKDNSLYFIGGAFLLVAIILFLIALIDKKSALKGAKTCGVLFIIYIVLYAITLLVLGIFDEFNNQSLEENGLSLDVVYYVFLPTLITLVLTLVLSATTIIIIKKRPNLSKTLWAIFCLVLFLAVATTLVLIYIYYTSNTSDWYEYNNIALWVASLLLVVAVIIASLFLDKKSSMQFDTKCLTVAGICISLSFVLSYIKLFDPPTGGSITLASLLPVMLFAYVYGMKKGLLIGFIYGILQAVQEPWIVHPAQFLLDYPIAFSMVGLAGAFSSFKFLNKIPQLKFAITSTIAVSFRFLSSTLAGVFAWGADFKTSLILNFVIILDVILVIVVGVILFSSRAFKGELNKLNPNLNLLD